VPDQVVHDRHGVPMTMCAPCSMAGHLRRHRRAAHSVTTLMLSGAAPRAYLLRHLVGQLARGGTAHGSATPTSADSVSSAAADRTPRLALPFGLRDQVVTGGGERESAAWPACIGVIVR